MSSLAISLRFLALLCLLMVGLLVGPRVPDSRQAALCVVNLHLPGPFGVALNCDSPEFMRLARQPSALLEENNTRQSRPGLIVVAAALERALAPLSGLAQRVGVGAGRADIAPERIGAALATLVPAYAAYILLNVAALLGAFLTLRAIAGDGTAKESGAQRWALLACGLLLVADDVVKAFVWSPHTQMFNLLVPLLAVRAFTLAATAPAFTTRHAVLWGLGAGLGMTAYATFALVPVALAAGLLARLRRPGDLGGLLLKGGLAVAVTLAPSAVWAGAVVAVAGSYYQHEMAQGQLVWIAEAWRQGSPVLARRWLFNAEGLVDLALAQAWPALAALAWTLLVGMLGGGGRLAPAERGRLLAIAVGGLLVAALTVGLFASTGLIAARVAFGAVPPVVALTAALAVALISRLEDSRARLLVGGLGLIALAQAVWVVVKDGPWS